MNTVNIVNYSIGNSNSYIENQRVFVVSPKPRDG